jgi:hypothetical protein
MTPPTASHWNPRRLLAVLATLSALLIGSTGCQSGGTAGPASPQVATQFSQADVRPMPLQQHVDLRPNRPVMPMPAPVNLGTVEADAAAHADSPTKTSGLCGAGYYLNSSGNCVPRPEQTPARPAGATAKCADGAYSFSQHRQGTCSGHGGVAQWL